MSEIQSAEEFANMIYLFKNIIVRDDKGLISDIRARDKAIIARIRKYLQGMRAEGEHDLRQAIHYCDDVLRELGGEQ